MSCLGSNERFASRDSDFRYQGTHSARAGAPFVPLERDEGPLRAERAGASESKGRMKMGNEKVPATCFRHPAAAAPTRARTIQLSKNPPIQSPVAPCRTQSNQNLFATQSPTSDLGLQTSDLGQSHIPAYSTCAGVPESHASPGASQQFVFIRVHSCSFVFIRGSPSPQHKKITKRTHFQKIDLPANKGDSAHCVSNLNEKRTHF